MSVELELYKPHTDTYEFSDTGETGTSVDVSEWGKIRVEISGSGGGDTPAVPATGGNGGRLVADVDVTGLSTIDLIAGEGGSDSDSFSGASGGVGYFAGGSGGDGVGSSSGGGAGGGGASAILNNSNPLVVVDGGGGSGGDYSQVGDSHFGGGGGGGGGRGGAGGAAYPENTDADPGQSGSGSGFGGDGGDYGTDGEDGGQEVIDSSRVTLAEEETGGGSGGDAKISLTHPQIDKTVDLTQDGTNLNPVRTHSGVSDLRGTVKADRSLEEYAQRQDRCNLVINGDTKWAGYLFGVSHDKQRGTTELSADGIEKRLEETRPDYDSIGGPVTYSNIALADAIRNYWGRTPFQNYTVTDQSTEPVATDALIQDADTTSEWNNLLSISADVPLYVSGDSLNLAQTNWVVEGENASRNGAAEVGPNDAYSDGLAVGFIGSVVSVGDYFEFSFTPEYDLDGFNLAVREDGVNGPNDSGDVVTIPGIDVTVNGDSIGGYTDGAELNIIGPEWRQVQFLATDTYSAGSQVTVRWEVTSTNQSDYGDWYFDVLSAYDDRYSYNFDNTLNTAQGYLDGPELYPSDVSVETDSTTASYNVTASRLDTTWSDTTGAQAIAVSNDSGNTYQSGSNTTTIDKSYSDAGRDVQARFTFDRYGSGRDATPRNGYQGQSVSVYNHYVDGDDLTVITELELTRNHADNLSTLHSYGDFLFVVEHTDGPISTMPVYSFQRGDETRPKPDGFDKQINQRPEIQSGVYFNSIYLEGALQSDGTRPTAEVKDQDAITNDGREISPGVLRDLTINTDAGALFRARALLDAAQSNSDYVGSVTVPPMMVTPAFARPVNFGNGEVNKTVEEVSLNISQGNADASFDFSSRTGLVDDLDSLKRNSKDQGNQV